MAARCALLEAERVLAVDHADQEAAAGGRDIDVFKDAVGQAADYGSADRARCRHVIDFARAGGGKHFGIVASIVGHQRLNLAV